MKSYLQILLLANCCLLTYNLSALAQTPSIEWQKTFGGSNYDQGESVIQTFDGGFIAAGISTSINGDVTGNHGFGDFWIVKTDNAGNLQWEKSYGGSGDDGAFSIEQTADSGYIVAGTSTSTNGDLTFNHGFIDYWVIKLDNSGNLQWQKSYGGSNDDVAYDINQTKDLGFIIAGYTTSSNGDVISNHGFEDYWIVKIDSAGSLQWEKTFGGTQQDRAYSIQQTKEGGYVVAGFSKSNDGDVTGNHGNEDYWIVKIDSNGVLEWQATLGGTLSDEAKTIQQTVDNGYIVAGFTASLNGDVTINHGFEDLWMVKLDSTGVIQWQRSFGGSGVDQAYDVKQLTTGGYIAAGSSYSLDGDVSGNNGGTDYWILKTDSLGDIVWQTSLGGSSIEEAYSISLVSDGDYIVGGGTLSTNGDVTSNHGDFDYWIIKLTDQIALPVEVVQSSVSKPTLNVFPNPYFENASIEYQLSNESNVILEVFDIEGKRIATLDKSIQQKGKYQYSLNTIFPGLNSGVFFVKLVTEDGVINSKLIRQ